jgi:hypothetical protein
MTEIITRTRAAALAGVSADNAGPMAREIGFGFSNARRLGGQSALLQYGWRRVRVGPLRR